MIDPFYLSSRVGSIYRIIINNRSTQNFRNLLKDIAILKGTEKIKNSDLEVYKLLKPLYLSNFEYLKISSIQNLIRSVTVTSDSNCEYEETLKYCSNPLQSQKFKLITQKNNQYLFKIINSPLPLILVFTANLDNYSISFLFETLENK